MTPSNKTSYDMLIEAADNLADLGVQGAPVKQRSLMDDRFFKSLNLLDRYNDPDLDKAVEEAWAAAQNAAPTETSHDINVRHSIDQDDTEAPVLFSGSDDQLDTVEEELHNLFTLTDKGQTATVKALGDSAKSLVKISTRLEKWFSWEQEEAWRAKAKADQPTPNLPTIYSPRVREELQPDADFTDGFNPSDYGAEKKNRRKNSRTRRGPGNRGPRPPNESWLKRMKRFGKGKGGLMLALALGGAALWSMTSDKQGNKQFGREDESEDTPEIDSVSVDSQERDTGESDTSSTSGSAQMSNSPSFDVMPTAGDAAAMTVMGAMAAPEVVRDVSAAKQASSTVGSIRQVTKNARGVGVKGNAVLSGVMGGAEALAVHYDDTLTDEEKNREYTKIGGSTAGSLAGGMAGSAAGASVGAWIGGIGGATLGSVVPVLGTAAGGAAGAAGGAFIGSLVMGYLGSLFGGEAGEAASEYVYDKVDQIGEREEKKRKDGEDINITVDTQPVADVLEENAKREEEAQRRRDADDKPLSSPIWRFNSPMMPSAAETSSGPMPASNMSGLLRVAKGDVSGAGPMPSFATGGPLNAPSLINMTDEQRSIIKDVAGGDEKAERFLTGVLNVENRGFGQVRSDATSPAGAMGPYQVMPATWQGLVRQGKASGDPRNFGDATRAMKAMYDEMDKTYDGNEVAMVAHYNGGNKDNRARLAGEGDYSKLPKETRDYLKYYFSGDSKGQSAEQRDSKPEMVSEVQPVERDAATDVERADLTDMKQPIVNVEVPQQEAPSVVARAKTPEPPTMLSPSAPSYSGGAGSTPTLDDMPILIADNGMLSMHTGKI